VVGAVCAYRDVTERNRLARAVAEQAEQLNRIIEAMGEGLFVYDAQGNVVRTNSAARRLLGLEMAPSDFYQSPAEERIAGYTPSDGTGGMPSPQMWLALRGEHDGDVLSESEARDIRLRALDGRELDVSANFAPLRAPDGQVVGGVLLLSDRTDRYRLERETRELAAQLRATLDAMADAVFLYDPEGQPLRLNAAAQALVDQEPGFTSMEGTAWWERVRRYHPRRPDGSPLPLDEWPLARVLRGDVLTAAETEDVLLTDAQDRDMVLNYIGGPARDAAGEVMGYVFLVRDVTERRNLEREQAEAQARELALRELNVRLDTFVAMAAHDLRSPLGISRMAVDRAQKLLRQDAAAQGGEAATGQSARALAQANRAVEMTAQNLTRLWRLVQQLLDATRVKQGTLVLEPQLVDVTELVHSCVDEQRLLNPTRVIEVDLPTQQDAGRMPLMVDADPERLNQVLTNYLTNAVRYSAEDQPIAVRLQVLDPASAGGSARVVRVEVSDHGPGITPEEQLTIWERYQRARSMNDAKGGLGLGLFIVRSLIEAHGGQVGVDSTVGDGSIFWFTLPLASAPH
jgi:signal transduction histidine kinase